MKQLLEGPQPLVMPDAYDALSARLIERTGFKAVQCSGYSMSLAAGLPLEADLSLARNLSITGDICRAVKIPVMADGEDGYGPPDAVLAAVTAFIEVGASGINIEDQILRSDGVKGVIDASQMEEKLLAAREAASAKGREGFIINGRTDALAAASNRKQGIDNAIERGLRYLKAGADLVFVTNITTLDEAREIIEGIDGPVSVAAGLPYNIQSLPLRALKALGPARISLPSVALFSAAHGISKILEAIISDDTDLKEFDLDLPL